MAKGVGLWCTSQTGGNLPSGYNPRFSRFGGNYVDAARRFDHVGRAGLLTVPAAAAGAVPAVHPSTRANATKAMHGEAFAHAAYLAYAQQARRTGATRAERAFRRAGEQELADHFTAQAALIGFVGDNAANLRDAIAGEGYEATTMYPSFARQARRDRCLAAANLFSEIARDEARHRDEYAMALRAVTNPQSGTVIPTGESVPAVPVPAGTPRCGGKTLANLGTTMRGEAFANAKYTLYANRARASGQPRVATLFENAAHQELNEHFAEEAAVAGLVRDNATNLRTAIAGERAEATTTYPGYARQAAAVGDRAAARLFGEIARDEARHARTFTRALRPLRR